MKKEFLYILTTLLFFSSTLYAQNRIESKVDTTQIKIGDSFSYTITAHTKEGTKITFPETEQIGAFEVIENYPTDTVVKQDDIELIKKYDLTQFDEGSYTLPQVPVIVDASMFKTDSVRINVLPVQVDTLKTPLYEIKGISKEGASFSTYWYYIIFVVLSIVVGIALYLFIKYKQEKNLTEDDKYKTPYEKAVKKLKKLEEKKNWTRGDAKPYYSEMSNVVRNFLEDTFDISAREMTTYEIMILLKNTLRDKNIKLKPEVINEFKRILETADLVKFAKSQPTESEIQGDTSKIQGIVDKINEAYPISAATQTERIRRREERKRRRMRFRIWLPIGVSVFLMLLTGIGYYFTTASEREYSLFTFNNTKKLLEKEWISSTYGSNPGITITTPVVLVRKNETVIQEAKLDGLESIQQFRFKTLEDPISMILSNSVTTKEFKSTEKEIIAHAIKAITQNYKVTDIQYEEDDFENSKGIVGTEVFGSFKLEDTETGKIEEIEFEGVLTQYGENRSQIWVFYRNNDKLAVELVQRVFESIQYNEEK
ncbi:BatD family protein [Myroides albus]|uniref:Oxygen tolerance n=1 Tax=Myroides albus TaxID=2562892 RepID=A0A6I3LHE9_9FLAO|nr:BatD family protein [Myroides albus]MTG97928.1 hypothetical protein [Myroides albus]UVD81116.1 BatD family protein [Myroides albus]